MADVKSATVRSTSSLAPARFDPQTRVAARPPVKARQAADEPKDRLNDSISLDPASALLADFAAPSSRTTAWLNNPRMTSTLEVASQALAPNGAAEDPIDRYAASVIETHLVARRSLSKLMNSLLKT